MILFLRIFLSLFVFLSIKVSGEEPLTVGMELSYPPFEMMGPDGHPTGISVDIAFALGKYLKRQVEIDNIPFIGLIPALKSGENRYNHLLFVHL